MKLTTCLAMLSMLALTIPACAAQGPDESGESLGESDVASGDEGSNKDIIGGENENTGEAEQALDCQTNFVVHYKYSDATGNYKWDVSYNLSTGKVYVDERRIGGGFYKQYVVTPDWNVCWDPSNPVETVALKNSGVTLSGPHDCLPDTREEVHLQDKQRVLSRAFITSGPYTGLFWEYTCQP